MTLHKRQHNDIRQPNRRRQFTNHRPISSRHTSINSTRIKSLRLPIRHQNNINSIPNTEVDRIHHNSRNISLIANHNILLKRRTHTHIKTRSSPIIQKHRRNLRRNRTIQHRQTMTRTQTIAFDHQDMRSSHSPIIKRQQNNNSSIMIRLQTTSTSHLNIRIMISRILPRSFYNDLTNSRQVIMTLNLAKRRMKLITLAITSRRIRRHIRTRRLRITHILISMRHNYRPLPIRRVLRVLSPSNMNSQ